MAWYDSTGKQYNDDQVTNWDSGGTGQGSPYFIGDGSSSPIALSQTDPTSGKGPTPWMNGFMDRWNQMGTIDGAPLYAALQKYGIDSNTFNWMDALNASDIGKGGNRQGFDLYSPERFTQAYLQGFGRLTGNNAALNDWMTSTGNTDTKIAGLDTGYADAKGKSDASAKMDWGSYIAPSLLAAPVAAGALLGAGGAAAGAGAAGETAGLASGGMSLAPGAFEGIGSSLIPAGANVVPAGLTAVGGGAAIPAAGALGGALVGAGAGAAGAVGSGSGGDVVASGSGGGSGGGLDQVGSDWATGNYTPPATGSGLPNLPPTPSGGGSGGSNVDNVGSDWSAGTPSAMTSNTNQAGYLAQLAQTLGVSPDALTRALGTLGSAGLGAYASSQNTNALQALYDRAWGAGQPSRDRFNAAMTPGFDLNSIPGYKSAMDTSAETYLRKLSAQGGNPAGIGAAPSQTQAYLMGTVGLPAWQNYASLNSSAGGLGSISGQATGAGQAAATSNGNFYNAIGSGLSDLLNPKPTQEESFLQMARALKAAGLA